jgi:hypothetical protein
MTGHSRGLQLPVIAFGFTLVSLSLMVFGLWIYTAWKNGNEVIADDLANFERLRSVAAYKKVLENLDTKANEEIYANLFLSDGTAAVISADLMTRLKQLAASRGVEIMQASDLQPKNEGPITLVGGSLQMTGTIQGIYSLAQEIELTNPVLFIDRLDIRSSGSANIQGESDTQLIVEMHVFGAVRSNELQDRDVSNQ